MFRAISLVLILLLAACAKFSNRLPTDEVAQTDPRINGIWYDTTEQEVFLHIATRHNKEHIFAYVERGDDLFEGLHIHKGIGTISKVDGNSFINVTELKDVDTAGTSQPPGSGTFELSNSGEFFIVKYEIESDRLILWPPDQKVLRDAAKSGRLKGTLEGPPCQPDSEFCESLLDLKITDSANNIAHFFAANSKAIFPEPAEFVRLRVPARTSLIAAKGKKF